MSDQPDEVSKAAVAPIVVKYRTNLPQRPRRTLPRTGTTIAGPLEAAPAPDPDFLERQKLAAGPHRDKPVEAPRWFVEEVEKGTSPEEIVRILLERVPLRSGLREGALILNEIGRLHGGGRLVRQVVTQQRLVELEGDGRKEKR
jgi:hypothetical protein